MKCPFCDEGVSSAAALCSSCREVLPPQNLFDFYRNEIAKDRTLVLKENRQTLDLRAQEQFETRSRLLKEARERQSEAEETKRRLDRENSLIEERKREKVILKNRQTRKKRLIWISKFVVAPLMVLIIALSFWINARQSAALTAKQQQESLGLCPLGPTLSFLNQKLLTMSPSEIGTEPFTSNLENAISRLDSFSTGRQGNTGIDAVRYLSIELTYLRNPMYDNLMIERISKARNQLHIVISKSNPRTCGNTGIPFATSSNIPLQAKNDVKPLLQNAGQPTAEATIQERSKEKSKPKVIQEEALQFPEIVSWKSTYIGLQDRSVNPNNPFLVHNICIVVNHYSTIKQANLIDSSGTWGDAEAYPLVDQRALPSGVAGDFGVIESHYQNNRALYCGRFTVLKLNAPPGALDIKVALKGVYPEWGSDPEIGTFSFAPGSNSYGS